MKKAFFVLVFICIASSSFSQNSTSNLSPNFKALASEHKVLAILPFDIRLELPPHKFNQLDEESLKELEMEESQAIQESLATHLIRKKNKKGFKVTFQDPSETNAIFIKKDINQENIAKYSRKELANILGVDGIVYGSVSNTELVSERRNAYYAFGGSIPAYGFSDMLIKIADAKSGEIIWDYSTGQNGAYSRVPNNLVNDMLRRAARKFPYKKL